MKFAPSVSTIARYLNEYRHLLTITRIRDEIFSTAPHFDPASSQAKRLARDRYRPTNIIRTVRLYHRQIYEFALHRGKLDRLCRDREHTHLRGLVPYLETIATSCPHDLFAGEHAGAVRASSLAKDRATPAAYRALYDPRRVRVRQLQNAATTIANFIVPTVGDNKARHPELQRFFLACDSSTIAVEIPIWLTEDDIIAIEKQYGRRLIPSTIDPVTDRPLPRSLTGHIDFLQIRNGALHILDYKPGSREDRPTAQLTLYALALSYLVSRVAAEYGLPPLKIFDIKCAWFDEHSYNEFFPRLVIKR